MIMLLEKRRADRASADPGCGCCWYGLFLGAMIWVRITATSIATGRRILDHAVAADSRQPSSGAKLMANRAQRAWASWLEHSDPDYGPSFHAAGHNRAFAGADPVGGGASSGFVGLDCQPLAFSAPDYDREIVVTCQSLSTMTALFTGMGFSFLLIAGLLFWAPLEPAAMMAAIALGMTLLAAGMGFYLLRRGESLLSKLSGV